MTAMRRLCISADSHVVEPAEVYAGLDKRFGDRAPRMIEHPERGLITDHGDGTLGYPVGTFILAGQDFGDPEVRAKVREGFKYARPGTLDTAERMKDQDLEGLDAEVLYPSVLFSIYQLQDAEIMQATMANYNDWVSSYAASAPGRLFALALVQLYDLDLAIAEMQRMANQGAVGLSVPCMAPADKPFSDRYYDPFWAAAQELKLPLTMTRLQVNQGRRKPIKTMAAPVRERHPAVAEPAFSRAGPASPGLDRGLVSVKMPARPVVSTFSGPSEMTGGKSTRPMRIC